MTYVPPISDIGIYGAIACGVPYRERICFRPTQAVNLAYYVMLIGKKNPDGSCSPVTDNMFWFGETIIEPPSWVVLFTASGEFGVTTENGAKVYRYCWGKATTLFHDREISQFVPMLFKIASFNAIPLLPDEAPAKTLPVAKPTKLIKGIK